MPLSANLEIMTFRYLKNLVLWLFDFVPPYTLIHPFIGKIDMTAKNFGDFIGFLPTVQVWGEGGKGRVMPWLCGFTWYAWPHKDIFHIHQFTIVFSGKLPISPRVVQESILNQIDGWVSILWEHLNYIQQQKRAPSGTWVSEKRYLGQWHIPCTQVCWVPPLGKMSR